MGTRLLLAALLAVAVAAAAAAAATAGDGSACSEMPNSACEACEAGSGAPSCAETGYHRAVECVDDDGGAQRPFVMRVACPSPSGLTRAQGFWTFQAVALGAVALGVMVMRRRKQARFDAHERRIARMVGSS